MKIIQFIVYIFVPVFLAVPADAQPSIRYQNDIRGGATIFGNSWFYSVPSNITKGIGADVDSDNTTSISCSADLILPAGSTIVKAYLSIEKSSETTDDPVNAFTSVKLKVPGASIYQTLTTGGTYSLASRNIWFSQQAVFDITALMPATGYVSTAGGGAGRYFLADPLPASDTMGGWSIIVVYSNPASKYRNITVADAWRDYAALTGTRLPFNLDITGVKMPTSGTVKAVLGLTGTNGDRLVGWSDTISLGRTTGTLTSLADPMTGSKIDCNEQFYRHDIDKQCVGRWRGSYVG